MRRAGSAMPTASNNSTVLSRRALPVSPWCWRSVSPICVATVRTGLREVCGSWKIMATRRPRALRMARSGNANKSTPFNRMAPAAMSAARGNRRLTANAVMDLPLPDSPNRVKFSPRST